MALIDNISVRRFGRVSRPPVCLDLRDIKAICRC